MLARIQAIMTGNKELADRMFMPAKMQAQAVKQALSLTHHVSLLSHGQAQRESNGCMLILLWLHSHKGVQVLVVHEEQTS